MGWVSCQKIKFSRSCGRLQRWAVEGEVCHGLSWQGWLKAQGSCMAGSEWDVSHATLGMLDANVFYFISHGFYKHLWWWCLFHRGWVNQCYWHFTFIWLVWAKRDIRHLCNPIAIFSHELGKPVNRALGHKSQCNAFPVLYAGAKGNGEIMQVRAELSLQAWERLSGKPRKPNERSSVSPETALWKSCMSDGE